MQEPKRDETALVLEGLAGLRATYKGDTETSALLNTLVDRWGELYNRQLKSETRKDASARADAKAARRCPSAKFTQMQLHDLIPKAAEWLPQRLAEIRGMDHDELVLHMQEIQDHARVDLQNDIFDTLSDLDSLSTIENLEG